MAEYPTPDSVRAWVRACVRDAGMVRPRALFAARAQLRLAIGGMSRNPAQYPRYAASDARDALDVLLREVSDAGHPAAGVRHG